MRPPKHFREAQTDPPPEAYSRVSDPERFRPLHARALDLLQTLRREYDVRAEASFELLPWMSSFEHARDPVTLTPARPTAAPLAVAFTPFPGLLVRFGRWQEDRFPSCGCDACRETAEGEGERFENLVRDVVAGHFREELEIPRLREPRLSWWLGESGASPHGHSSGSRTLSVPHADLLGKAGAGEVRWQAWPRRVRRVAGMLDETERSRE